MKRQIAIREVLMHQRPHLDEILAYVLLLLAESVWGVALFPNFKDVIVRPVEGDVVGTDEEFDKLGILPIGCGGGRFDEHRPGGRLDKCASMLVAEYLGLAHKPELRRLLNEAQWCDTHGKAPNECLAELIKCAHRLVPDNLSGILNWAAKALDAVIICEKFRYAAGPKELKLDKVFKQVVKKKALEDEETRTYVEKRLGTGMSHAALTVTMPQFIVESLQRHGIAMTTKDDEGVADWLRFAVNNMITDHVAFKADVAFLRDIEPIMVPAFLGEKACTLKLIACQTESLRAQAAACEVGADLLLARNKVGNVQISIKRRLDLNLSNVMRMIRWTELPEKLKGQGRNWTKWLALGKAGRHPDAPMWYYQKEAEKALNGSLTHSVPPTKIHIDALREIMYYGFHPDGVNQWREDRHLNHRKRHRPSARKQEGAPQEAASKSQAAAIAESNGKAMRHLDEKQLRKLQIAKKKLAKAKERTRSEKPAKTNKSRADKE